MEQNQAYQIFPLQLHEIPNHSDDPTYYPDTTGVYRLPIELLKKDFKFNHAKFA
jgi:hypothetical protein